MIDPHPQRLTLLQPLLLQPHLLQQLQRLGNSGGVSVAAEDLAPATAGIAEPSLDEKEHVGRDVAAVAAFKGRFVVVEQAFQDGKDGFVGDLEVQEEIDDPCGRADAALVVERVAFQQGHEDGDGEGAFREVQARAEASDLFDDGLVWLGLAARDRLPVCCVQEVLPRLRDVGRVAMVGGLVDQKADVEIACLVCVAVVELGGSCQLEPLTRKHFYSLR